MQVGAFTTEEKHLKKYVGGQWSDMALWGIALAKEEPMAPVSYFVDKCRKRCAPIGCSHKIIFHRAGMSVN